MNNKCKGLLLAQNYSCQLCIILAIGCQNLDRLNKKLSEVLYVLIIIFVLLLYVCEQHTMYTQASLRIYTGSHADKVSTKLSCVGLNSMHIAVHIVMSS